MALHALLAPLFLSALQPGLGTIHLPQDRGVWRPIDGVAFQVGDEIITLSEFEATVRGRESEVGSEAELRQLLNKLVAEQIARRLEIQEGEDMGLDARQIDKLVRDQELEARRDQGVNLYADTAEREGLKPLERVEGRTQALYRDFWRRKHVGLPLGGERPVKDRYLRPGILRASYQLQKDALAQPTLVRLQILEIQVAAIGSAEGAEIFIEDLRNQILDGEDFGSLVLQYGSALKETEGETDLIDVARITLPVLKSFAEDGKVDDLSEPLPIEGDGRIGSYMLAKILEKEDGGPVPAFGGPETQSRLRRALLGQWEEDMLGRARSGLSRRAYVWQNPILGAQADQVGPPAPRAATAGPEAPSESPR